MKKGDVAISLGTSDTIFVWLESLKERSSLSNESQMPATNEDNGQIIGHIFPNPVDRDAYMALIWQVEMANTYTMVLFVGAYIQINIKTLFFRILVAFGITDYQ